MNLHELSPAPGSRTKHVRVGRGLGSGLGKTSGKGQKGQKSRSGGVKRPGFEGGQRPLYLRFPKRGFYNRFGSDYVEINVGSLNCFEDGTVVEPVMLIECGMVKNIRDGVRILGNGELTKKLTVQAMGFSKTAEEKIIAAGGDPERETLNIILTKDGANYLQDEAGDYWRSYVFIDDATCFDLVEKPEDFYNSAVAFGHFQQLLADYPAATLHETIKNFHNTVDRFHNFLKAVEEDVVGRAKDVQAEIEFVKAREADCHIICDALANGEIPLRVTHNDTKLNNVMIDNKTGKGLCVIDLDTVMPGSALYDYGDSIRFGASTAAEDEQNLDLVSCDMNLFEIYTKGYTEGCAGSLTEKEIRLMPMGAKLMTLECGMRFLTDHLQNDIYFKIHRENHNLDRARTQFKLVADMEAKWDQMNAIVEKYL